MFFRSSAFNSLEKDAFLSLLQKIGISDDIANIKTKKHSEENFTVLIESPPECDEGILELLKDFFQNKNIKDSN